MVCQTNRPLSQQTVKTKEASVMKVLDSLINRISHSGTDDEPGHAEELTAVILVGFLSLMAIMTLI